MPPLESQIDLRSEELAQNRGRQLALLERVQELERRVRQNSARSQAKFEARRQLLPRQRISRLLDLGAPFLELSSLAGYHMHDDDGEHSLTGGGSIVGIGVVSSVRALLIVNDSAIKGGAVTPMGLKKSLRAQEIARLNRLPLINLVESAGANLNYQAEIFVDGGRSFANLARLSAAGIPVVTVVHGSSTAGGAYLPGLSDYVVVVRDRAKIFLAGPPLVKAALGQEATDEELGGAVLHATTTGTAEYLAEDDAHALEIARDIISRLNWPCASPTVAAPPPRYDPDELLDIVPVDYRTPYDAREIVARIVDDSDFLDFKRDYGPHTLCGHARIENEPCGVIANNGPIDADGATKAAHFIQLCCQSGTPLVYLQNTTGYMVGKRAEERGIVKHGSKMIQAVANATVPQLTVIVGASFGAGNYGMCGRAYDPRFLFSWPASRIAVMGGEQAASVMVGITEAKQRRQGQPVDRQGLASMRRQIEGRIDEESTALYATARLWDDGIIDPRQTRSILGLCLRICREGDERVLRPNSYGVARP